MIARALGGALLALLILPLHLLLGRPETGLAGAVTVDSAATFRDLSLSFLLMAAVAALTLGAVWTSIEVRLQRAGQNLLAVRLPVFALLCGLMAGAAALAFNRIALHGQPNLIDAVSQLQHAQYVAQGSWTGSASPFVLVQQGVVLQQEWLSQYPPGHVALLALATAMGLTWLLGPLLLAVVAATAALLAERLLPHDRLAARLGAALSALSPFLIAHAGAYMSHTSAAAFAALAVYAAVRCNLRGAGMAWAGAALGALFVTRPLTGLTVGLVLAAATIRKRASGRWSAVAAVTIGALPFAGALAFYNRHFFGSPFRFGYDAALGPNAGLGFGTDPWGNQYGLREAIGYTSAELSVLNVQLVESLLPAVLIIGVYLLLVARPSMGEWLLIAWACAPLLTHLFYWHHGLFMGPRMLNEYAPAWCLLFARGLTFIYRALPAYPIRRYSARGLYGGAAVAALAAMLLLGPARLAAYAQPANAARKLAQLDNALVFVHGSWEERIGMQLIASGMRLDQVEAALRQNETCLVHAYVRAGAPKPTLDLEPRATSLPRRVAIGPGSLIRANHALTGDCLREARADRNGVLDVGSLLLANDARRTIARDLGPELNQQLLQQAGDRPAYLLMPDQHGSVVAVPYRQGMEILWGSH